MNLSATIVGISMVFVSGFLYKVFGVVVIGVGAYMLFDEIENLMKKKR